MPLRPKLLLTFALIATVPLLVLSIITFIISRNNARSSVRSQLEHELTAAIDAYQISRGERDQELLTLASTRSLITHISHTAEANGSASIGTPSDTDIEEIKDALTPLLQTRKAYARIAAIDHRKRLLFVAQPGTESLTLRTRNFVQNESEVDPRVWSTKPGEIVCAMNSQASTGKTLRCATHILNATSETAGVLASDLKLDELWGSAMRRAELMPGSEVNRSTVGVVLDKTREIVYHTNDALKHQSAHTSAPELDSVANHMVSGETGSETYRSSSGDEWLAVYGPVESGNLSVAVARNLSLATTASRRAGWFGIGLALLLGLGLATVLTLYYQRQTQSIERVTEDVTAIAKGKLDLHIDAPSREDIRPLADSVNLMTERMREQIAREAETRQFQSFVRLSAMLTHDLKNAIGSLSLLVSNMEQHFDNEQFRADAMKSLTGATEKLRALVDRISNPVTTLSGEFKRPHSTDLTPIFQRVVSATVGPLLGGNQIEVNVPEKLFALVDSERIEKVVENLLLNGLEAMGDRTGKLTIAAGKEDHTVYFTVTDTGVGMSQRFIEEKLFHAFATTKKHGMGLGLYTCREVVQANGGTIEVQSKQGVGTTFRVVLPSPPSEELV